MSLGLLAKDSIQDLTSLGRDAEASAKPPFFDATTLVSTDAIAAATDADAESSGGGESVSDQSASNPQQGQDSDEENVEVIEDSPMHQTAETDATASLPPTGAYEGFKASYNGYTERDTDLTVNTYLMHDSYAPVFIGESQTRPFKSLLCCLLPWVSPALNGDSSYEEKLKTEARPASLVTREQEEDEKSNSSDALGEKMSEKERQAMLARLGLPQPDGEGVSSETSKDKKGLLNGIPTRDTSPLLNNGDVGNKPIRGILKRRSTANVGLLQNQSSSSSKSDKEALNGKRRSLFPTYDIQTKPKNNHHVDFSPMARVVTVKSKNDMTPEEKANVWWQKQQYEDFRKTGRIITRAMLEGGSEIWLASNESWKKAPNATKSSTLQSALSITDKVNSPRSTTDSGETITSTGDKWWHKFGHSRRGLEHVVSIGEGRERQMNVRTAIRAVLDEQVRQKMYRREDPEKLRIVSLYHTSWARDLALASGSSDADAVKSSFSHDRKSREFYLLKLSRANPAVKAGRHIPVFMQPENHHAGTPGARMQQLRKLDSHTATQIRYRRSKLQQTANSQVPEQSGKTEEKKSDESCEPIHDAPVDDSVSETMAHRAAGFSPEGVEKVNMAAVLSGMGAMPLAAGS